jgi:hypothetical protein
MYDNQYIEMKSNPCELNYFVDKLVFGISAVRCHFDRREKSLFGIGLFANKDFSVVPPSK